MTYAHAMANNDVVLLAWDPGGPIPGCLGFDIRRRTPGGRRRSLPVWVGFSGDDPALAPRTTLRWPIQKYTWRDLSAEPGATYVYDIVPMVGEPDSLERSGPTLTTNPVTVTPLRSAHVSVWFNRGIIATQHLTRLIDDENGEPDAEVLRTHISTPGDAIRTGLADQILEGVTALIRRAKDEGGHCFCALYELADPELVGLLTDPAHVTLLLSNAGIDDATNADARAALHAAGVAVTDRMLGSGHIGHNKFVVYVDPAGVAQAVLTGSTNWTSTGLCCQTNNAILIEDTTVAATYLDYWQRIVAESPQPRATQTVPFRLTNQPAREADVDGGRVTVRMSPNTRRQTKPTVDPEQPVDLSEVAASIAGAREGLLFLLFQPGRPSVLDDILEAQVARPDLFVRGAATDPNAIGDYSARLFHRTGETAKVAAASAINDDFAFWQKELLKLPGAHAVVHDKIIVIDPMSETDCVVITGSHNLGFRASYNNDDNMLIVRGNRSVAQAYLAHVLDVYDHYRWRFTLQTRGRQAWTGLSRRDSWQNKYFSDQLRGERRFFSG